MESCSNQKSYILSLRFFKATTFAMMTDLHTWNSLNQLHEVVTWNIFQLTGVPC
jgi:hypothetical protein